MVSFARIAAGLTTSVAIATSAFAAASAPTPVSVTTPPTSVSDAVVQVVDRVCRPAADTQTSPAGFAAKAGYTAEPQAPAHLPVGMSGLSTWLAPSPQGKLYVMSGLFPESTTPSSCLVALYDAKPDEVVKAVDTYVLGLKRGFVANPRYDFVTGGMHLTRYDRRVGDTLHSVMLMQAVDPQPGQPGAVMTAFVVDYGWMLHPGRKVAAAKP